MDPESVQSIRSRFKAAPAAGLETTRRGSTRRTGPDVRTSRGSRVPRALRRGSHRRREAHQSLRPRRASAASVSPAVRGAPRLRRFVPCLSASESGTRPGAASGRSNVRPIVGLFFYGGGTPPVYYAPVSCRCPIPGRAEGGFAKQFTSSGGGDTMGRKLTRPRRRAVRGLNVYGAGCEGLEGRVLLSGDVAMAHDPPPVQVGGGTVTISGTAGAD